MITSEVLTDDPTLLPVASRGEGGGDEPPRVTPSERVTPVRKNKNSL